MIFLGKLIFFRLLGQKRAEMTQNEFFFQISKINAWNFSDFLLSFIKARNYLEQIFRKKIAFKFLSQKGAENGPKMMFFKFFRKKIYCIFAFVYCIICGQRIYQKGFLS